jgi:hypothetical protein
MLLHCWYTVVTLVLHWCYTVVTLLLHCCHTFVTLLLHWCYTADLVFEGMVHIVFKVVLAP